MHESIKSEEDPSMYDSQSVDIGRMESMEKPRAGSRISNSLNESRVFNDSFVHNFVSSPHDDIDHYPLHLDNT